MTEYVCGLLPLSCYFTVMPAVFSSGSVTASRWTGWGSFSLKLWLVHTSCIVLAWLDHLGSAQQHSQDSLSAHQPLASKGRDIGPLIYVTYW